MDTPRVSVLIKRYANRKLYNTESSCYITLKGVSELVRAGRDISVIDNETGQDITRVVLSQILVGDQKQSVANGALPGSVFAELIQRGGDALSGLLRCSDDMGDNLSGVRENVRRWLAPERDGSVPERSAVQTCGPVELTAAASEGAARALERADLATRGDLEILGKRLEHVEAALREIFTALRARATH